MAYWVAKVLNINPNEILNNWTAPELIIAFGEYANEHTQQNLAEWKSFDSKTRGSTPKPSEYIVYFHNNQQS